MSKKRKVYSPKEKFQIVLELLKGRKTQTQITSEYGVHPTQQNKRKEEFIEHGESIFTKENESFKEAHQKELDKLHKIIGQHAVEVDWLKKKLVQCSSYIQRVEMIEENNKLSITRQSKLLSVSKSSHYYDCIHSESELKIMDEIDKIFTEQPYYGSRRISAALSELGYKVGRKKTRTYMHIMGIKAIYPKKNTSKSNKEHKKYKYLLKGVEITRINQVWSTDITYIKIPGGFVYLMAVIDWYSRYIIAWDISVSMDGFFCNSVLKKALEQGSPEIFNSDQGSQFTANEFISIIESHGIQVSMDGVGRCYDNILIERLWRTIKYEDIHIHEYQNPTEVYHGLNLYINRYNHYRLHQSLNYKTPGSVYLSN